MVKLDVSPVAQLSKRDRVVLLLEHWQDFWETMELGGSFADADGSSVALMPAMSRHPSVLELVAALGRTRALMPTRTAHLMAIYTAEWRNVTRSTKRKTKKGKVELVEARVRERIIPPWVRKKKADTALVVLVAQFRGDVFIPKELLEPINQAA